VIFLSYRVQAMARELELNEMARHWIDGAWLQSGRVADSYNPATGEVLGRFADGGEAEARAAVGAAHRAFEVTDWARDRALRSRALLELAELFEAHVPKLALMLTRENGKTLAESTGEVGVRVATLRHNAAQALTDVGTAAEVAPGQYFSSLAEPVGVVAIIVPWNAPVALFIRSLGPALAAGNTVAAKLPGQTALTNALMAEIVSQAPSLPAGVVNMFTESGNTGARFLVESADVDMVSFTGSIEVGRQIAAAGAKTLKRMNLELGGKTPMIVFDDAPLASTLPILAAGITTFAGQNCMAGSRILVQRGIADQVREHLADRLTSVVVGPGEEKNTQMASLIDSAAVARVDRIVEDSASYAKVIVRGGLVTDGPLASGAFYRPSLIEVEDLDAPIIQQEIFGPVARFEVFDDEKDAISRANATEFGLAAAVFTRDVDRARRVSRQINAGTVWTNTWFAINNGFEEGGYKQSGLGRLRGAHGLADFQQIKTYVHLVPPAGD
jgi:betaine-aldehyde dehydrogenase